MGQNLFRIGGCYRNLHGAVCRLTDIGVEGRAGAELVSDKFTLHGDWSLATGEWAHVTSGMHFAPGELLEVEGRWVPAEEVKEASSADKLIYEAITQAYFASKTPTLDKLANTAEPKRERLTWADSKAFDAFPGYSVTSHTNEAKQGPSHPLQRTSEGERIPGFGSAYLIR
jgi:hypothetical protein